MQKEATYVVNEQTKPLSERPSTPTKVRLLLIFGLENVHLHVSVFVHLGDLLTHRRADEDCDIDDDKKKKKKETMLVKAGERRGH